MAAQRPGQGRPGAGMGRGRVVLGTVSRSGRVLYRVELEVAALVPRPRGVGVGASGHLPGLGLLSAPRLASAPGLDKNAGPF